jgi:hypothetical protein
MSKDTHTQGLTCDTCGEEVEDEQSFQEHNRINYVRHVFLSHPHHDAQRIVQEYINRCGPYRNPDAKYPAE